MRDEFKPILNSAKTSILQPLLEIVEIYANLTDENKDALQNAFNTNTTISVFSDKSIKPIKYKELNNLILSEKLKAFCVNLWDDYPQVIQMKKVFGTVKDHYDKLIDESNCDALICPFCGIDTFEPSEGKYREAYDHLIAKADYPFVSINFNLLFPACHKCNSNEKRTTDTLFNDDGTRRTVYYPYDLSLSHEDLEVRIVPIESYDITKLETFLRSIKWQFELFRGGNIDERLESWDTIYGIKRRYFERLNRLEKEWFYELQRKYKDDKSSGISFKDFKTRFMKSAKYQILISGMGLIKYSYFNFLFSVENFEEKLKASLD